MYSMTMILFDLKPPSFYAVVHNYTGLILSTANYVVNYVSRLGFWYCYSM